MKNFMTLIMGFALGLTIMTAPAVADRPGLPVGTPAPDFVVPDHQGQEVRLSELNPGGPVVLILYRGGWCYYCNLQLQDYERHFAAFDQRGVSLLAVSVDRSENAAATVADKALSFTVASNPGAEVLRLYNAEFIVPDELAQEYQTKYGVDLEAASGRSDHLIAVPATYIIDPEGMIVFAHSDEDYKIRKRAQEVLDALDAMGFE